MDSVWVLFSVPACPLTNRKPLTRLAHGLVAPAPSPIAAGFSAGQSGERTREKKKDLLFLPNQPLILLHQIGNNLRLMPPLRLRFSSASAVSVHRSRHAFGVTLPLPDCPDATWTGRSPSFGLLLS